MSRLRSTEVYFFQPRVLYAGDRANLLGRNLPAGNEAGVSVTVNGAAAAVLSVAPNVITFLVPAGASSGAVAVKLPGMAVKELGVLSVLGNDGDRDGLPDAVELALGLDPAKADSNGNGIPDGLEDSDGDTLKNLFEVLRGIDPTKKDGDGDGLDDAMEVAIGTDPRKADTDGDGWPDDVEILVKSSPISRNSQPRMLVYAATNIQLVLPQNIIETLSSKAVVARPPAVSLVINQIIPEEIPQAAIARPPAVSIVINKSQTEDLPANVTVARPPSVIIEYK